MAGLIVGKLGFGKNAFFYGLELCLHKAGRTAYRVTPQTASACDVVLITMFWWKDILLLEAFLRDAGIRKGGKPYLLAGGMQATMCPQIISRMVDAVFIGDADNHLGGILDQLEAGERPASPFLYQEGDESVPLPAVCVPSPFVQYSDIGGTARIEIARGCKFKCAFCALSGIKPYQEVPFAQVVKELEALKPGRCSLFAPERLHHSEWSKFREWLNQHKGIKDDTRQRIEQPREKPAWRDLGSDARLEKLPQVAGWEAITGIEGISHRLRKSIGKPFTQDFILRKVGEFVKTRPGIARLTMYFIADLPGETEEDWKELYGLFGAIEQEEWSRHLVMFPVLNPLSPKPFTALENAIVHPFRDYTSRWRALCRNEAKGRLWGFRVVETIVWGPFDRIMDAIVTRGGAQGYEVVRRLPRGLLTKRVNSGKQAETGQRLLMEASEYGLSDEVLGLKTAE